MSLKKIELIRFNGKELSVKELTVNEVAEVMDGMKQYKPHVLDLLMSHDLPVDVVIISTGLDEETLMASSPSELVPLYDTVINVNPHLAVLTERLKKAVVPPPVEKPLGKQLANS